MDADASAAEGGKISIHAPRKGERLIHCLFSFIFLFIFQSTLPARGSDILRFRRIAANVEISIHAPRKGERHYGRARVGLGVQISIHAPRKGERLYSFFAMVNKKLCISIHAPRKGERRIIPVLHVVAHLISIHAPRKGERHCPYRAGHKGGKDFNPRSPQGGATADIAHDARRKRISIHAPRKGERQGYQQSLS